MMRLSKVLPAIPHEERLTNYVLHLDRLEHQILDHARVPLSLPVIGFLVVMLFFAVDVLIVAISIG